MSNHLFFALSADMGTLEPMGLSRNCHSLGLSLTQRVAGSIWSRCSSSVLILLNLVPAAVKPVRLHLNNTCDPRNSAGRTDNIVSDSGSATEQLGEARPTPLQGVVSWSVFIGGGLD